MREADALGSAAPVAAKTRDCLSKESLIRTSAEYSHCYNVGKRLHTRHFLLFVAPSDEEGGSLRMGTAVSRKVGHAVVRNRLRRLLRECFRLRLQHMPASGRIVVVAKRNAGTAGLSLDDVTGELTSALASHMGRGDMR